MSQSGEFQQLPFMPACKHITIQSDSSAEFRTLVRSCASRFPAVLKKHSTTALAFCFFSFCFYYDTEPYETNVVVDLKPYYRSTCCATIISFFTKETLTRKCSALTDNWDFLTLLWRKRDSAICTAFPVIEKNNYRPERPWTVMDPVLFFHRTQFGPALVFRSSPGFSLTIWAGTLFFFFFVPHQLSVSTSP